MSSQTVTTSKTNNIQPDGNTHSKSPNSSNGTTSVIRKKLKFTDELLWKQFSSRRLQLVESLSLSSKKASEQDEEIKICANTLMNEFHFPESTLPEFDKLVRLAIQSVRRNKKRSEKRLASKLETFTSDDEQFTQNMKRIKFDSSSSSIPPNSRDSNKFGFSEHDDSTHNLDLLSTILLEEEKNKKLHETSDNFISSNYSSENDAANVNLTHVDNNKSIDNMLVTPKESSNIIDFSLITSNNANKDPAKESENIDSRIAVDSLVGPVIQDSDKLPSIKKLDENPEFSNAAQKILYSIKNSKCCYEFSKLSGNEYSRTRNYDLLEEFGSACINSAVLYTLEKWFDHLLPDSSSYIKLRLKSDLTLGLIVKNLDKASIEVNRLSDFVASQLFKKLIGGCIKDFGFNSILNPLCDIFHSIITKDYPIIAKDQLNKNDTTSCNTNGTNKGNYFTELSIIDSTISKPSSSPIETFSTSPVTSHTSTFTTNNIHDIHTNSSNTNIDKNSLLTNNSIGGNKMSFIPSSSEIPDFPLSTAHLPIPSVTLPHLQDHSISDAPSLISTPPVLRSKHYTNVNIKFKDKELKFRYCMESNAPPTVLELITNCKQAFGIVTSTRILNLKDLRSGNILKTDHELERVLRMVAMLSKDGNGEVDLELVFVNVTQGYLNLNYDSSSSKSDNKNIRTDNSEIPISSNSQASQNEPQINSANNNGDNFLGRYLPPPRPIRPDTQPRGVFMKFQPLL